MSAEPREEYLTTKQVAERLGIQRQSVTQSLWRGLMAPPDLILLDHPLWMPETIDNWIAAKHERASRGKRKRKKRKKRTRVSQTAPPKNARLTSLGAKSDFRPSAGVGEEAAKEIAAALRGEGQHCTALDVVELAGADPGALGYDRRRLQHRIQRKLRGLNVRA